MALRPFAWPPVAALAGLLLTVQLAMAGRYGFHRDELYFVEAGEHLAFGYADQPPLAPLIGRAGTELFGSTPTGFRAFAALAAAACVVLVALIAREMGGGRGAQVLAAAVTAVSALVVATGHMLSTTTFDVLAWVALSWLLARMLRTGDARLWVALGGVTGISLQSKHLVLFFWAAIGIGLLAERRRDLLLSRWTVVGAAIALAVWLPNLVWQADHGWPQLELAQAIAEDEGAGNRAELLPLQLVLVGLPLVPLWIGGLVWLARGAGRPWRAFAWAYPVLLAILLVTAGKGYYAGGMLFPLVAAGSVAAERWLAARLVHRAFAAGAVALTAGVSALLFLPVVPAGSLADTPIPDLNEEAAEMVGWPRFVDTVAGVWRALPPAERRRAVIFTGNYGEAGAIDRFGPARGLPRAYSGHNSYADWGIPPDGAAPVIVVYPTAGLADEVFEGCTRAARIDNGLGVDNEEQGMPVFRCRSPRRPWRELWPRLRHIE